MAGIGYFSGKLVKSVFSTVSVALGFIILLQRVGEKHSAVLSLEKGQALEVTTLYCEHTAYHVSV